jgi:uncharacterized protein involved in exopolysaccharide biosynthesis
VTEPKRPAATRGEEAGERIVYVIPPEATMPTVDREVDLGAVLLRIWRRRWLMLGVMLAAIAAAAVYLAVTPPWYRGEVVMVPAQARNVPALPGALASLGGLAGLAGISVGGGGTTEPLAVLTSTDFTREFVVRHGLLPILFEEDWDGRRQAWKDPDPTKWPDERDAVKRFDENVRSVYEDKRTGKIRLVIEWTDPKLAADWANAMVGELNERMRQRAQQDAEANLAYLRRELESTPLIAIQESVGRLIEGEIQKAMLAKGEREFSFKVVDHAKASKWRAGPRRALVLALAALTGLVLGVLAALLVDALARRREPAAAAPAGGAPDAA